MPGQSFLCIVAQGLHKSMGKTRRWTAAQGKAKVMDDHIEPRRSPRPRRQSAVIEAFGENTATTITVMQRKRRATTTRRTVRPASGRSPRRR